MDQARDMHLRGKPVDIRRLPSELWVGEHCYLYIDDPIKLRGMSVVHFHRIGTWYARADIELLEDEERCATLRMRERTG